MLLSRLRRAVVLATITLGSFSPNGLHATEQAGPPTLVMQTGHSGTIRGVDVGSDGKLLGTGGDDGSIRIWRLPDAAELRRIPSGVAVRAVAFSPDSRSIAAVSLQRVTIWEVNSGEVQHSWSYFDSTSYFSPGVTFTPDGKNVVVVDGAHLIVWNLAENKASHVEALKYYATCFAAHAKSATLAFCQRDTIVLWDTKSLKVRSTIGPPKSTFEMPAETLSYLEQMRAATKNSAPEIRKLFSEQAPIPGLVLNVDFDEELRWVVTNHYDGGLRVWNPKTGEQVSATPVEPLFNLAVHPRGESIALAGTFDKVVVRSAPEGEVVSELNPTKTNQLGAGGGPFAWTNGKLCPIRYTPDGLRLIQGLVGENRLVVWDVQSHASSFTSQSTISVPGLGVSGLGAYVSTDHHQLYSVTGNVVKSWPLAQAVGPAGIPRSLTFGHSRSRDGLWMVWRTNSDFEVISQKNPVFDRQSLSTCAENETSEKCQDGLEEPIGFSADDRLFFVRRTRNLLGAFTTEGTKDSIVSVRVDDGLTRTLIELPKGTAGKAAFCPGQNLIAWFQSASLFQARSSEESAVRRIHLFDVGALTEKRLLEFPVMTEQQIADMVRRVHEDNPENFSDLFPGRVGSEKGRRDAETVSDIAFSSDGLLVAAAFQFHGVTLWRTDNGIRIFQTGAHLQFDAKPGPEPTTLAFDPEAKLLVAGWNDGTITKYETGSGKEIARWMGHDGSVKSVSYAPEAKLLISTGGDGTIKFWDPYTNSLDLTMIPGTSSSDWVTVSPSGFFDGGPDGWARFLWRFNNSIFETQPIELYFREYFHPGLLQEFFSCTYEGESACERLRSREPLTVRNRVLPIIESISVVDQNRSVDSVSVQVRVRGNAAGESANGRSTGGVFDVRLFRDGQIVGQSPEAAMPDKDAADSSKSGIKLWRKEHSVKLDDEGRATITFENIRLPRRDRIDQVTFTAYAFNSDRIKSTTTRPLEFELAKSSTREPTERTAFLVTMGVNANQSRNLDLEVAVPSAETMRSLLRTKLTANYSKIVEVPLYSEYSMDGDGIVLNSARKSTLKTVLDLLAGRSVSNGLRDEVDPKHQLRAAGPDDALVVYVASHGYADPGGMFYMMPSDTGTNWGVTEDNLTRCIRNPDRSSVCKQAQSLLNHSISSADLTAWWTGIDAGEMTLVLDSCHSGAVPGKEFRPAPLGDPGFGQLSFDKGMVIFAASQSTQTALGGWLLSNEGHTVLVDTLEALAKANADESIVDWLHEAQQRLPEIAKKLYPDFKEDDIQVPFLLDFSRETRWANSGPNY